jgi:MYXO-CTERM domain-containing protein
MRVFRRVLPVLMLGLGLGPASSEATVSAGTAVTLTWDGTYQTNLSGVPGAPDIDWSEASVPYAKLHFSATSTCADFDGADVFVWDPQYEGGTTYYVANKAGTAKTETAVDASVSYDQYVHAGAAYLFSGYSRCDGAAPLTWDSDMYFSQVVEVPPVIARVWVKSQKTGRFFNKLKAGETLRISVGEYTPRDFSSATFDPRVYVVVEGAGVARKEYDITDRTKTDFDDIKPTQKGTLTLKLKVQNYLYYRDDWHNVQEDWSGYDWESKVPAPDYATTLLSTDRTCDHVSDGVPCPKFGQPIFRAVPYTLESAPLEIPVEETWCLVQDRANSKNHVVLDEGCHSCSATYNANADPWEDACAPADPDKPGAGLGGLSCSATGSGLALAWLGLALLPALRRRRGRS